MDSHSSIDKKDIDDDFGIPGVRLKHFETVVAKLLQHDEAIEPKYVCLPPIPSTTTGNDNFDGNSRHNDDDDDENDTDWPFSFLPQSARVLGTQPGQLKNPKRAQRKEGQLRSMLRCVLRLVDYYDIKHKDKDDNDNTNQEEGLTIVDFGGGSGHLGIPLALLLPTCRIVVVDLNKHSLQLMHDKAKLVVTEIRNDSKTDTSCRYERYISIDHTAIVPPYISENDAFTCCGSSNDWILNNLFTFYGPVEQYVDKFDMAIALHLCGEATDVTIRKAAMNDAKAMVLAPCCVGKLSKKVLNPDIYHATGQNIPTIQYPQSNIFCQVINTASSSLDDDSDSNNDNNGNGDWDALAKAADYSDETQIRTNRNATRRVAKALLETDRRLFLEHTLGYKTALMRMDPWEVTPKNDILVAWKEDGNSSSSPSSSAAMAMPHETDRNCQRDIQVAKSQLFMMNNCGIGDEEERGDAHSNTFNNIESSDWSQEEVMEIESQIRQFFYSTSTSSHSISEVTNHNEEDEEEADHQEDKVLIFPTRMGGRKRKLIHFVASKLDLAHWGVGKKDSEKTVAVARRRPRRGHKARLTTNERTNDPRKETNKM